MSRIAVALRRPSLRAVSPEAPDSRTPAFADFGGNRRYIAPGNLSENPRPK